MVALPWPFLPNAALIFFLSLLPRYVNSDYQEQIFILKSVTDSEAVFEHQPLFAPSVVVKDQLSVLKKWKLTKKEPTMLCPEQLCIARLPHNALSVQKDFEKATATQLLMEAYMSNKVADESLLAFASHPSNLFLMKKAKKKEVRLYPIGTLSAVVEQDKAKTLQKTKNVVVWFQDNPYLIQPFKNLSSFTKSEAGTLCPFFWAKSSEEADKINLQTTWINHKGLKIPILENDEALPAQTLLLKCSGQQSQEPPAKKSKTK